ncbi:hypothetical protein [Fulvivirga sediminis]|uniref:Uncharacterized protein n=1 Tax=Fulvivirga sediminis TaxID=2803949 RepID=A0A937K1V8_9BACT|nr:hypothetical protein [Fulvivirga sediminis]MBL3657117.1 hypothetical protein [Fulvivirga sediminis]
MSGRYDQWGYGFGTYNQSENSIGKSLLIIATDITIRIFFPEHGIESMNNRALNG